jgi:ribulose-phosphate 3-epimerase
MNRLAPSILSADFSKLGEQVSLIEKGGAGIIHVDVMDGHFVPNISFGAAVMKSLTGKTKLPFDVHLMITDPDKYAPEFVTPQTEYITIHQEATIHLHRSIQVVKNLGVKVGVALNPATPISSLENVLSDIDMVLIMSVNPGFGGQKFIPVALEKVRALSKLKAEKGLNFDIEVDGGVTLGNVADVAGAGANLLVAGSAVFGADDIVKRCEDFNNIIK